MDVNCSHQFGLKTGWFLSKSELYKLKVLKYDSLIRIVDIFPSATRIQV